VYSRRVISYEVTTPLFSDFALKDRAIYVPDDQMAEFDGEDVLAFPVGTVLLKSFTFVADFRDPNSRRTLVETRLLVHHESGWKPYPYV